MSLKDRVSLPTARLLLYTPNESLNRPTAGWLRHPEVVNAKCLKWGYFFSGEKYLSRAFVNWECKKSNRRTAGAVFEYSLCGA